MQIRNNFSANQAFGMAFSHRAEECQAYLSKYFNNDHCRFRKALAVLDKNCDAHRHFDIFYSSHDDSVKIIGKTDLAGEKLSKEYGETVLSVGRDTEYPNYSERFKINLDKLEKSPMGPKDVFERLLFKAYKSICLSYAKLKVKHNPYEDLPPNVRKGVDIINNLEKDM